jgi:L,D-peptidoglycan transpeptidase YkuD (ErfK/YbiS/YcfS/YnhG family)
MDFSSGLQLIVLLVPKWDSIDGILHCFERKSPEDPWVAVGSSFDASVGKKGMAWGLGVHHNIFNETMKMEGDMKAPAGIFALGPLFGSEPSTDLPKLKMPYIQTQAHLVYVDDPSSVLYNRMVVVTPEGEKDWNSAEKMLREDDLYSLGLVIRHNENPVVRGRGSCIFMHKWRGKSQGSAGCTVMPEEKLKEVLFWIDQTKHPLLIQMPTEYYQTFANKHSFPLLSAVNG